MRTLWWGWALAGGLLVAGCESAAGRDADAGALQAADAADDAGGLEAGEPDVGDDGGVRPEPDAVVSCVDHDRDGAYDSACGGTDCDDRDEAVHPGALEVCGNAADDDCDQATPDDLDGDGDGIACTLDCDDDDADEPNATGGCDGSLLRWDFEAGPAGWTVSGHGASWQLGEPRKPFIDSAASGRAAWVTNLLDDHNNDEDSFVTSPSFDLSDLSEDPVLMMSVIHDTEPMIDWMTVEYSFDGSDFRRVGATGEGHNWYTRTNEWEGRSDGGWQTAFHRLTGAAGRSDVRIRVTFHSDISLTNDGAGFDDVRILKSLPDLGITATRVAPFTCVGDGEVPIGIDVLNSGNAALSGLTIAYRIDDESEVVEHRDLELEPGERAALQFQQLAAFELAGDHEVRIRIASEGDAFADNDQRVVVTNTAATVTGDYREDFELDDGQWHAYGTGSTWHWGVPDNPHVASAPSGQRIWQTGFVADGPAERSYLQSGCFDFSALAADPVLHFALAYRYTEDILSRTALELSIDGGQTWQVVGDAGTGGNWYDEDEFDIGRGWASPHGTDGAFRVASHRLTGAAGSPRALIRFAVDQESSSLNAFAIDDVQVSSTIRDLALEAAHIEAEIGCSGRRDEALTLTVVNRGAQTIDEFEVSYGVDSGSRIGERVTQALAPDGAYTHTFVLGAELAAIGPHRINVVVAAVDDARAGNDARSIATWTHPIVAGLEYANDFEDNDGGFRATGHTPSWAWGEPNGAILQSAWSGERAWMTGLDGVYAPTEQSQLTSPCLDFSAAASDPTFQFAHMFDSDGLENEAWVEVSLDGGRTFEKLGSDDSGHHWYDGGDVWSNGALNPAMWVTASHPLYGAAGHGAVLVRFQFVVDAPFGFTENEGHCIDDVAFVP